MTLTKKFNTIYYQRNKRERRIVHQCPHCSYETTGPKQCIKAHIWSKHTPEHERPFQCPSNECNRGFASRANLNKHMARHHNIIMPKNIKSKKILAIHIKLNPNLELRNSIDIERLNNYSHLKIIQMKKLLVNEYNFTLENIYYDNAKNYIEIKTYTRDELMNIINNP